MSTAVMTEQSSPHPTARAIGVVYLLYFVTVIVGELFIRGLVVPGDAAATANSILARQSSLRLGLATGLVATAVYVAVTVLLYGLLKPVNSSLALLATFSSVVGCSIQAFASLFQLAALIVLQGSPYLGVFKAEQLQALALIFLNVHSQAVYVYLVFFGVFDFLIGYLIFRSTFLPRILGVLMALAGLGWLTCLSPSLAKHLSPYIEIVGFLAELLLLLWLLVKGVNVERWREQAIAAAARK